MGGFAGLRAPGAALRSAKSRLAGTGEPLTLEPTVELDSREAGAGVELGAVQPKQDTVTLEGLSEFEGGACAAFAREGCCGFCGGSACVLAACRGAACGSGEVAGGAAAEGGTSPAKSACAGGTRATRGGLCGGRHTGTFGQTGVACGDRVKGRSGQDESWIGVAMGSHSVCGKGFSQQGFEVEYWRVFRGGKTRGDTNAGNCASVHGGIGQSH
jgi:hypothetical protein